MPDQLGPRRVLPWVLALLLLAAVPAAAGDDTPLRLAQLTERVQSLLNAAPDTAQLVAAARPSVVSLYRFDGAGELTGYGTGFVVGQERFILTNAHVVDGAARLMVALDDGTLIAGAQYLADPIADVAVVVARVPEAVPALQPAASPPAQGEPVVVLGNGSGLRSVAVTGVVAGTAPGGVAYPTMVLNTTVQPGHSGSPVLDASGRVAGMVALARADAGGLSYAIPYDVIQHALGLLQSSEGFVRAWLGVLAQESFYAGMGLKSEAGLEVLAVAPGSAAAAAGLRPGDEVTEVGGTAVHSLQDLRLALDALAPGTAITVAGRRAEAPLRVQLMPDRHSTLNPGAVAGTPATTAQGLF